MEDDEDIIKKSLEKEDDYDEYSVEELLNQIKNLKKKTKIFRKFTKK